MRTVGLENNKIVLLEFYPCQNKQKLRKREQYWMNKLNPSLNQQKAFSCRKERFCCPCGRVIQWAEKARHLKSRLHVAWENKFNEKQTILDSYTCKCGSQLLSLNRIRHEKTKRHLAWVESQKK